MISLKDSWTRWSIKWCLCSELCSVFYIFLLEYIKQNFLILKNWKFVEIKKIYICFYFVQFLTRIKEFVIVFMNPLKIILKIILKIVLFLFLFPLGAQGVIMSVYPCLFRSLNLTLPRLKIDLWSSRKVYLKYSLKVIRKYKTQNTSSCCL